MAKPMTADQWLKALRAEGVRVEEYPGWRTRGRDAATGLTFGPVRMFLNHHTAGQNARDLVAKNGVAGLPGPLAHVYLARSGVATMCSAGRANHAGKMAANAYASFRDEKSSHPAPSASSGTIDGNDISYGIEAENRGDNEDEYPRVQYDAWVRINAAACRFHDWGADSVGCHKETSIEGKIDPRGPVQGYGPRGRFAFTPKQFRADVAERLRHPASWNPGDADKSTTAPSKSTPTPVEDPMPTIVRESVAGGPDLPAGEWLELPAAEDTAILRGPCTYAITVTLTLAGTQDAGRVQLQYSHVDIATRRRYRGLAIDVPVRPGDVGVQVARTGSIPAGQYLKLSAIADQAGAAVTHRVVEGLVWR